MRSGQLAHLTGVSTDTLRHYERLGLLPLPQRTDGNYRQYPPASQQRVELIQRAMAVGFSLSELKTILAERDSGGAPCRHVRALMHSKIRDIDEQIRSVLPADVSADGRPISGDQALRSEDGKKCLPHHWSLPRLYLRFIYRPRAQRIPATVPAKVTARNTLKSGGSDPAFLVFSRPKKFSGSLPPVTALWCARVPGRHETASLLAARVSGSGEVDFTPLLHPCNAKSHRMFWPQKSSVGRLA